MAYMRLNQEIAHLRKNASDEEILEAEPVTEAQAIKRRFVGRAISLGISLFLTLLMAGAIAMTSPGTLFSNVAWCGFLLAGLYAIRRLFKLARLGAFAMTKSGRHEIRLDFAAEMIVRENAARRFAASRQAG
jgi:hypothetical protein